MRVLAKFIMLLRAPRMHYLLDLALVPYLKLYMGLRFLTVSDLRVMIWVQVLPRPKEGLLSRMMRLSEVAHTGVEGVQVTSFLVTCGTRRDASTAQAQQAASLPCLPPQLTEASLLHDQSKLPCWVKAAQPDAGAICSTCCWQNL